VALERQGVDLDGGDADAAIIEPDLGFGGTAVDRERPDDGLQGAFFQGGRMLGRRLADAMEAVGADAEQ